MGLAQASTPVRNIMRAAFGDAAPLTAVPEGGAAAVQQPLLGTAGDSVSAEEVEEMRRRARRQHRKRIAQIVVDHWKWFARGGLQVGTGQGGSNMKM